MAIDKRQPKDNRQAVHIRLAQFPDGLAGNRRLSASHWSLPRFLAGVCGYPEFARSGVLVERKLLVSIDRHPLLAPVAALASKAGARRGYGPSVLGLVASGAVVAGKFALEVFPLVYGGVALLLGASTWDA